MPWCPKCQSEYRKEFDTCSDCGSELVEELEPDIDESELKREEQKELLETEYDKEELLAVIPEKSEADLIVAMLEGNGIPVLIKQKGSGEYFSIAMNMNNLGVELYVPSQLLDKAKGLLEHGSDEIDELKLDENEEAVFSKERLETARRRRTYTWLIILIIILPAIAYGTINWIQFLLK